MRFGSLCSGIEAASVAWEPLGMTPAWLAEIDPFCSAVLANRWPEVANLGDMTADDFLERMLAHGRVDVIVGGPPCQAFSVIGRRGGMSDQRGQLSLRFLEVVEAARPEWIVWENVPGVLSSGGGRDFGTFLRAVAQLGYGWAYRILDAASFGLAQNRKRVYLVGHSTGRCPAEVLALEELSQAGAGELSSGRQGAGSEDAELPDGGHWCESRAVAFRGRGEGNRKQLEVGGVRANALTANEGNGLVKPHVWHRGVIRRMTPVEYERLQGFPDNYTQVVWKGRPASDCRRYKAVGNSMPVPVMRWIGMGICAASGLRHIAATTRTQ